MKDAKIDRVTAWVLVGVSLTLCVMSLAALDMAAQLRQPCPHCGAIR